MDFTDLTPNELLTIELLIIRGKPLTQATLMALVRAVADLRAELITTQDELTDAQRRIEQQDELLTELNVEGTE